MSQVAPADVRAGAPALPRAASASPPAPRRRYVPLLYRVAAINAILLATAVTVTIALLAPGKVSALALDGELVVVLGAVALVVLANVYLLRRVVGPIQALTAFARQVDYSTLGQRIPEAEPTSEAGELALTFSQMLERLQAERREATGRVLRAQEDERLRIAQELHDQVGQELTAVLLGLSRLSAQAPPGLEENVLAVQDIVRDSLEDVRRIAIELRPEALDDLGLPSALAVLADRFAQQLGLEIAEDLPLSLPPLPPEAELVVYRVAQEALTNVARHSASSRAEMTLECDLHRLVLIVRDYGLGLAPGHTPGTGMRGMRERATLIGAQLKIDNRRSGSGCEVRLEVPLETQR
ncbi:MAG TPA: histidine kinase [Solirubrobacteraceae bacterium]|nr:histidine kinase [Solirubrobacteraceae bacterium]